MKTIIMYKTIMIRPMMFSYLFAGKTFHEKSA